MTVRDLVEQLTGRRYRQGSHDDDVRGLLLELAALRARAPEAGCAAVSGVDEHAYRCHRRAGHEWHSAPTCAGLSYRWTGDGATAEAAPLAEGR